MINTTSNLIDRLNEIVDKVHIEEVKQIILSLTKINNFKHSIEDDLCEETLYNKILNQLQSEFGIDEYMVSFKSNGVEKFLYKTSDLKDNNFHKFSSNITSEIMINIYTENIHLDRFKQISLNSYCSELVHLVYIRIVLNDLQKSATIDPLTKLQNRISFNQEMKTLIPLALREKMNLGLLLINIDRFRAVNDEHGDEFGDEFLKLYAETILKNIRSSDIAVRFSGGEFLVLLINVDTEQRVLDIAEKIKEKLANTYLISPNGDQFKKTVCVGVSMFPGDSISINEVIKNAEMALSDARDQGRNSVLRFNKEEESTIDLF
jgi:two-component system, cell cycle response regulator